MKRFIETWLGLAELDKNEKFIETWLGLAKLDKNEKVY